MAMSYFPSFSLFFFFFNAPPTTEIYTLSLHDALPIYLPFYLDGGNGIDTLSASIARANEALRVSMPDRKSTRLNSSHTVISYAVFCLKKKKKKKTPKYH